MTPLSARPGFKAGAILALVFVIGIGGAVQVGCNNRAGAHFGYGIFGTVLSFGGGSLILSLLVAIEASGFAGAGRPTAAVAPAPPLKESAAAGQATDVPSSPSPVSSDTTIVAAETAPGAATTTAVAGQAAVPVAGSTAAAVARPRPLVWLRRPSPWHLLPGALGVLFVSLSIVISGYVGYALWWIPVIVSQLSASAALDHYGLSRPTRVPLTWRKATALAVALIGAILTVLERLQANNSASSGGAALPDAGTYAGSIIGAIVAGVLMPAQAALNRSASERLPSKIQATWWSFAIGTATALIAFGINTAVAAPGPLPASSLAGSGGGGTAVSAAPPLADRFASSLWWMYAGGPLGVIYIGSSIIFTGVVGSAPFFVVLVCGQLVGAAALDATATFGGAPIPVSPMRGAGIVLVMLASAAVGFL